MAVMATMEARWLMDQLSGEKWRILWLWNDGAGGIWVIGVHGIVDSDVILLSSGVVLAVLVVEGNERFGLQKQAILQYPQYKPYGT